MSFDTNCNTEDRQDTQQSSTKSLKLWAMQSDSNLLDYVCVCCVCERIMKKYGFTSLPAITQLNSSLTSVLLTRRVSQSLES